MGTSRDRLLQGTARWTDRTDLTDLTDLTGREAVPPFLKRNFSGLYDILLFALHVLVAMARAAAVDVFSGMKPC